MAHDADDGCQHQIQTAGLPWSRYYGYMEDIMDVWCVFCHLKRRIGVEKQDSIFS